MNALNVEVLRVEVYRGFVDDGHVHTVPELAAALRVGEDSIREGLAGLADEHHLVLDELGRVVMAHPFSSLPLGFSVMGHAHLWWGGCAWDSFALAHLLPRDHEVLVATSCPNCSRALAWTVTDTSPPEGKEVAHFLVPVARMWDDVVHTCSNQRLYCSATCVDEWLVRTDNARGCAMDLATLWRLSSRWYEGRLGYGYVRRDPATASAYFNEVGLRGPFWEVTPA